MSSALEQLLGLKCFVIAEAGVNHNGSLDLALQLVDRAADAGADAVKFQTFCSARLATPDAPSAEYQRRALGHGQSQFEMLRALELSHEAHVALQERTRQRGIVFLSTPFDAESADFLDTLNVPAFKVSSGDLTNLPFLNHLAQLRRPILLSTGMADLEEIKESVETIRRTPSAEFALLQCVSNYPADPANANLRAMETMRATFDVPVGYSDHTLGSETVLAAVALGGRLIEKHLTLDRTLPGPDHGASAEPQEFAAMVRSIRTVEAALGNGQKTPAPSESGTAAVARKSLAAARDLQAGDVLDLAAISVLRPGTGIAPKHQAELVGRSTRIPIRAGTLFTWEALA